MSQPVDTERIKKFKKDRKSLPYDDIAIAKRMKVDRSNYSKAVNNGPITNAFLQKFYGAFGNELKENEKAGKPVDLEEATKRIEALERQMVQFNDHIVRWNDLIMRQMEQVQENTAKLIHANLASLEALVSRLEKAPIRSQDRREG